MKFYCGVCDTKYRISDEKLRGKVLKIKCKVCSNVVVVNENGVQSGGRASTQETRSGFDHAPKTGMHMRAGGTSHVAPENTEWFVAIKGKQTGPMSKAQLLEMHTTNKIHDRSYCWHEGLANWTRFNQLPDFQHRSSPPPIPPLGGAPEKDSSNDNVGVHIHGKGALSKSTLDFGAREKSEEDIPERGHDVVKADEPTKTFIRSDAKAPENSTANAIAQENNTIAPPAPLAGNAPPPPPDPFGSTSTAPHLKVGAPVGEKTRIFIAQAGLANRKAKHRTYAATSIAAVLGIIAAGYLEWRGLIHIPFVSDIITDVAVSVGGDAVKESREHREYARSSDDATLRCQLLGNCPKAPTVKPAKKVATKRPTQKRSNKMAGTNIGGALGDLDLDGAFGGGKTDNTTVKRSTQGANLELGKIGGPGGGLGDLFSTNKKSSTVTIKKGSSPNTAIATSTGSSLDPKAVSKVVNQNKSSIAKCLDRNADSLAELGRGKKKLNVLINNNGSVKRARFKQNNVNGNPAGQCIIKAAKRWRFPAYSGELTDVDIPLLMSAGM